jgi:NDP-sugar pyrophosphorylase family protein
METMSFNRPKQAVILAGVGKSLGVNIQYSLTAVDDDTGLRLQYAKNQIDDLFFFLYCDNYCPLDFNKMWESFYSKKLSAQITAYLNSDKHTKDNLRIGSDSIIEKYDKSRTLRSLVDFLTSDNPLTKFSLG